MSRSIIEHLVDVNKFELKDIGSLDHKVHNKKLIQNYKEDNSDNIRYINQLQKKIQDQKQIIEQLEKEKEKLKKIVKVLLDD